MNHFVSFVQVRGSVPVFWSQPGFKYRPPPRLDKGMLCGMVFAFQLLGLVFFKGVSLRNTGSPTSSNITLCTVHNFVAYSILSSAEPRDRAPNFFLENLISGNTLHGVLDLKCGRSSIKGFILVK